MTIRYVGIGGDNAKDGLTWANRKLTLNGVEDSPVAAGDTVYVGAGTYRETLTCDVSGSSGSPITYIGDYDGSHTDGVGGVVRISGSDDDKTTARAECVYANGKNYRSFYNIEISSSSAKGIYLLNASNLIIDGCVFANSFATIHNAINIYNSLNTTIRNCIFSNIRNRSIDVGNGSLLHNTNTLVENCLFIYSRDTSVLSQYCGGITVNNCTFLYSNIGVGTYYSFTPDTKISVKNSIFYNCTTGINAYEANQVVENYNNFYLINTPRNANVGAGANSTTYSMWLDTRMLHEMLNKGRVLTPFDLQKGAEVINKASSSPSSFDMRGTGSIGGGRELGALEYDDTLKISVKPTLEEIADAVWDEAISGHTTGGTFGAKNQKVVPSETINDYKADVSSLATTSLLSDVKTDTAAILADTGTDGVKLAADQAVDVTKIGGQAIDGNNATLKLKALDIQNSSGTAVNLVSTGGNGHGLRASGNGTGYGLHVQGGATANGAFIQGGNISGNGISLLSTQVGGGAGLSISGANLGVWINGTNGDIDADEIAAIKSNTAAILADTGTDGVVLANNAITAAKIAVDAIGADEIAAGAVTKIATGVWASATRTLSSFGTLVADIWASATRTLSSFGFTVATNSDANVTAIKAKTDLITTGTSLTIASAVSGSTITAHRGDTLSAALENIGALTNYSKLWFTVKRDYDDADTAAVIQIEKTGGLLYLNGAVGTAGNGSLTINDVASGDVTIVLNASETAKLSPGNYQYDIQILRSAGTPVSTLTYGEFVVPADVTRATS